MHTNSLFYFYLLSLFIFMHWRRKWQPTPVFLPGESQGRGGEPGGLLSMGSHSQTRLKGLSSSSTRDAGSRLGCSKGVICLGQWFLTLAADAYPLPPRNSLSRGCPCPGISRAQNKPPGHSLLLTVDMGSARLSVLLHLPHSTAQTLNKHWFVSDDSR